MSAALVVPVMAASLVGSLHCAGMCGGFVAFYSGGDENAGRRRISGHLAYNGGRFVTYVLLGAVAGSFGAAVDLAGSAAGVGRVAAVVAGSVMVLWGLGLLLSHAGLEVWRLRPPAFIEQRTVRLLASLKGRPPVVRAGLIGLSSTLLPCGWLYAFAVTAAGTGSALGGATVMAAFWAGTVPVLFGLGLGLQSAASRLRRHVPVISALALIVVGMFGVLGRVNVPSLAARSARHAVHLSALPAQPAHPAQRR